MSDNKDKNDTDLEPKKLSVEDLKHVIGGQADLLAAKATAEDGGCNGGKAEAESGAA